MESCRININVNITPVSFTIHYYSEALQQELLEWPSGLQARYLRLAERLEIFGPNLGMPHTRAMGDGLFELRVMAGEGIGRVFFCTMAGQRIVMLHQFIKKSQKIPVKELDIARTRRKEWTDAHAR